MMCDNVTLHSNTLAAPLEFNYGPAGGPSYSIAFMGGKHYNATVPLHQARAEPRRSAR